MVSIRAYELCVWIVGRSWSIEIFAFLRYMQDILKLVVVAAVAFAAYHIFVTGESPIKNTGSLKYGGTTSEESVSVRPSYGESSQVSAEEGVMTHHTVHPQIQEMQTSSEDIYKNNPDVLPYPQISNNFSTQGAFEPATGHNFNQMGCFPKDQLTPAELMPRDGGFAESNPTPQGTLSNKNFFESGYHAGLNTQGGTLRNGNRQLRSDPVIPRKDVGPWHQTTIEPDTNRRVFEIGN